VEACRYEVDDAIGSFKRHCSRASRMMILVSETSRIPATEQHKSSCD
jgi:hypothetical protein